MIGNETDAATALRDYRDGWFDYLFSDDGSSRSVHEVNGVLYKVNRDGFGPYSFNEIEYRNYLSMRDILPTGIVLPYMSLYEIDGEPVIAVEKVEGIPTGECTDRELGLECCTPDVCFSQEFTNYLSDLGFTDQSYGNAAYVGETLYLLDIA